MVELNDFIPSTVVMSPELALPVQTEPNLLDVLDMIFGVGGLTGCKLAVRQTTSRLFQQQTDL
jgi:hypothetical protein